jgi:hypothetical protein
MSREDRKEREAVVLPLGVGSQFGYGASSGCVGAEMESG